MSQYSQMVGSFIRTGNYPIEANYIFETYEDLVNFYTDEVQAATLHKGLLKIVEKDTDDKQALYWVTKKQTNDELEFTKLISGGDIEELRENLESLIADVNARLDQEIEERKSEDKALWGTEDKTQIPDDLNSIMDLANALVAFKEAYEESLAKIDEALTNIFVILKALAGSPTDKILTYLGTLDYQNLTEVSQALHKFLETRDPRDNKVDTLLEIQDFLEGFTNDDTLQGIINDLREELWGDPTPNTQFRTMRGIQDFVEALASISKNREDNLQTELDQTQVGVGLSGDGSYNADSETYYLKNATSVMNALKILDSLINEAINNCNLQVEDTNTVDLSIDKYRERTVLTANVLVSRDAGNGIVARADGLYHKVVSEYENGVLTLKVNDNIVAQHVLGLAFVGIKRAYYDPATESIVMEFKKEDGTTDELRIPVTQLIREWVTDNSGVSDVIVLTRIEDFEGGSDKLSADVRLYQDRYNILVKEGNTLYVKGTADNIVWNDVKVSIILDNLSTGLDNLSTQVTTGLADVNSRLVEINSDLLERINNEIVRAKQAELELDTKYTASQEVQDEKINALQAQADENSASCTELTNRLDHEILERTTQDTIVSGLIATERNRAEAQEQTLDDKIEHVKADVHDAQDALQAEVTRATTAEQANSTAINEEYVRASEKEANLQAQITAEVSRSTTQDQTLSDRIFVLTNELVEAKDRADRAIEKALEVESAYAQVDNKIDTEITRAKAKEDLLEHSIGDETTRATLQEDILEQKIENEVSRATTQELTLKERIETYINQVSTMQTDINTLKDEKADKSMLLWYNAEVTDPNN